LSVGERLILMGVIGKPHGVRGLLRVNAFTEDSLALAEYPLVDKTGRRFALEWVNDGVAQLAELSDGGKRKITDRNEAERLTNVELFAPRSVFPAPDDDEFYLTDLIGLLARDQDGRALGTISVVHDYGGGTSLEIAPGALLVPFTKAAVPVVDIAAGHVVVHPPAEMSIAPGVVP
jgi:16S rRNA processing protein RimM